MNNCLLILVLLCCCNKGNDKGRNPDNGCRPDSGFRPDNGCRPERPQCGPSPRTNFPNFSGSGTCGCEEKPVS